MRRIFTFLLVVAFAYSTTGCATMTERFGSDRPEHQSGAGLAENASDTASDTAVSAEKDREPWFYAAFGALFMIILVSVMAANADDSSDNP